MSAVAKFFGWGKQKHKPRPQTPPSGPTPPLGASGRLIRVTEPGTPDVLNRMYSYWANAWLRDDDTAIVFVGHADNVPRFYKVELSGRVEPLGALVPYEGTSEGWTWDARGRVLLPYGSSMMRVNPFTGLKEELFNVDTILPGCRLWQAHSSDDGESHSATVERIVNDGPYPRVGTVVFHDGLQFFDAKGALDESQISRDGRWLLIKEDDDNRVVDLNDGTIYRIANSEGAVGHSDNGPDFVVGEDDQIGACIMRFFDDPLGKRTRVLFNTWNMGHVSVRGGRILLSDATSLSLVDPNDGKLTKVIDHGMVGGGYDFQVHANLDPSGRVAAFVTNDGTDRMDAKLVVL